MATSKEIQLPPNDTQWTKNNVRCWPRLVYEDLVDYLILKKAYDGKEMRAFRSLYGKNYVDSGWLGDIYDISVKETGLHFFKTTVSPSQPGVGRKDYQVWAAVSEADSTVETGYCTCPAGAGKSCSHISALIYAVVMAYDCGVAGSACTDKPQAWGKSSSQILAVHEHFTDIVNENHNKNFKRDSDDNAPKPKQFLDHKDLTSFVQNSTVRSLWECKGTLLNKIFTAQLQTVQERQPLNHGDHSLGTDYNKPMSPECEVCRKFFEKYVKIGVKAVTLSEKTIQQSSAMWMDSRKVRITASKVHSLPKTARADPNKCVTNLIYQRFKGSAATRHGHKFEPVARDWFEKTTGIKIRQSGIVIRDDEMYIAASPDGLIDSDTIVEIKCPTKSVQEHIQSGKYDVALNENGKFVLNPKGKNGYYTQVQMTMFCTKTKLCKLIVWTTEEKLIVDVPFDAEFVADILPRIRKFYFEHLLVRLADELHFGRLTLSTAYKKLCS